MKIISAEFETSAAGIEDSPAWNLPEFAFIGRSNVGKSSLLNLLVMKKDLARVSARPGATQLVNFFRINRKWALVDMPGYGYSKTPQALREGFREAVSGYLAGREQLRCVFVLIDSRHSPQKIDLNFCGWLAENGIPFVLVFTKTDKSKAGKVKENMAAFVSELREVCDGEPRTFLSSTKTQAGRGEILEFIDLALR
ncbi:GTP-binding protein [Haloferula luteola]|uniref:Probable GTP-binding protein EngB n=1 Tax=Haloferula luteola TaxID=595692 RepID=A0A840V3F8_9BACT|nr:ribosome biogenesis GTP-binding protein YihA/YsxC [Haloferula luteola]MBB5352033.1 GTP-binding protein [Haloferula luteola]